MELLRSLLFIPADSPRKMAKARTLRPDAFIFDLEDAVPLDKKLEARKALAGELASAPDFAARVFVRVNGARSEFFDSDLREIVHPRVDGILFPKCADEAEVVRADQKIWQLENEKGITEGKTRLVLILETALGVVRAYELARSSPRIIALNFGAEDYCADMGVSRTASGDEVAVARSLVAQAAHAARLEAIDTVFTDFRDDAGLFLETRRIKQMGFTGKVLIHPNQIEPVHRAFAPTAEEMEWATHVIKAFEAAKAAGSAVVAVGGKMVDEPVVLQARRILQQREANTSVRNR
ncbi:MAG: CoA ester lyase [Candidatus Acidiferrales bacterium]